MIAKTKAIILKNTNYSESSIISKMYTREFGVRTYILQSVRKGKASVRPSMIQPLSLVEMDVYEKTTRSIGRVKELKNTPLLVNIHSDMMRKSIAIFYIEVLNHCITEELCEEDLFDFLEEQILQLETTESLSFLPLRFLLKLTTYLGVQPQGLYSTKTPYLSIQEGVFVHQMGTDTLSNEESELVAHLMLTTSTTGGSTSIRKSVLKQLIRYFQYHVMKNKEIKSVDILSDLLA